MRKMLAAVWTACAVAASVLAPPATAQGKPVVVELYTSQGCSSCPPADALLEELAKIDGVIPLALHVDYWDYIGWKDTFASPAFTQRQRSYARAAGHRTIYTPQMIVGGVDHVVGYKPMEVSELLRVHRAAPHAADLRLTRSGDTVTIRCAAFTQKPEPMVVQMIRYTPSETVAIGRGENAGKTITYTNIVTELTVIDTWDGVTPLNISAKASGNRPVVVLLQKAGHRGILAAARLR